MECDVPIAVRGCCFKNLDQLLHSIEVNPITDPLQILENRLKGQHLEPHHSSSKARHSHISPNIDEDPLSLLLLHLLQELLHRRGNVGPSEGLPLEGSHDVFVGFIGQISEVGERIEKREFETFDGVGENRGGLRGVVAIEGANGSIGN